MEPFDQLLRPRTDITVAVCDVHVRYQVHTADVAARTVLPRPLRRLARAVGREPAVVVRALRGVSLVARAGESIGIVGLNGSGKSTLLRTIAGLERPSRGRVLASSTPVLLGVNAALLPELSGLQNVRLGCLAMGLTPEQTEAAVPDIVGLADIGGSVHLPMKTYSSGMGARLRFAIAVAARPHILLIDEALATGDAAFKDRSKRRIDKVRAAAGTVFLVSHAAQTVEEECTRALWLHHGRTVMDGPAVDVARRYRWWSWNLAKGEKATADGLLQDAFSSGKDTQVSLVGNRVVEAAPRHQRGRRSVARRGTAEPG